MALIENQSPRFSRLYKKLGKREVAAIHNAMDTVIKSPKIGERKVGDLSQLFVFKFKSGQEEWLLGYTFNFEKKTITWHAIGQHENFYRDLKRSN